VWGRTPQLAVLEQPPDHIAHVNVFFFAFVQLHAQPTKLLEHPAHHLLMTLARSSIAGVGNRGAVLKKKKYHFLVAPT
jgi:hypothetical protein